MTKLQLPDVTLVGVETAYYDLTKMALEDCLEKADFGDAIVVSDEPIEVPGVAHHYCKSGGVETASAVLWYVVPPLIKTSHFLICHWDAGIIDPNLWRPEFLDYDYIGAKWWYGDAHNVGNGGFSLRSSRLSQHVANSMLEFNSREDDILCRKHRAGLENLGFSWAPDLVAERFAFERMPRVVPSFGFHGLFNWPLVYSEEEIERRLAKAPVYLFASEHYKQMEAMRAKVREARVHHGLCA